MKWYQYTYNDNILFNIDIIPLYSIKALLYLMIVSIINNHVLVLLIIANT